MDAANQARDELELAVAEDVEARRVGEPAIGVWSELIPSTVDVELFPLDLPFGMGQEHAPHSERAETEFDGVHHLTGPANRAAAVTETELARDDEDVVSLLLVAELLERLHRLGVLAQVLRSELPRVVVIEPAVARLRERLEDLLDLLAVYVGEEAGADEGEGTLHPVRKPERRDNLTHVAQDAVRIELRPVGTQDVDLVTDLQRLAVAREVAVARGHLLVGVPTSGMFPNDRFEFAIEALTVGASESLDLFRLESRSSEDPRRALADESVVRSLLCGCKCHNRLLLNRPDSLRLETTSHYETST